jgi:hypothetical protein
MNVRVTVLHDVIAEAALDARDPRDAHEVTESGEAGAFDAAILTLQQPWMELTAHERVEPGAALRIDTSEAVWLGEVEQCAATDDGFSIRVRLRHVLRDFETLARLAERFGTSTTKGIPVQI